MSDFGEDLTQLCATEFSQAFRDPERLSAMIARLGTNLATAIAVTAHLSSVELDELIEVACEAVAQSARLPVVPPPGSGRAQ